jgi:hypothetical protein
MMMMIRMTVMLMMIKIVLIIILIVPEGLSWNIQRVYYFFLYSKRKIPCTCCLIACLNSTYAIFAGMKTSKRIPQKCDCVWEVTPSALREAFVSAVLTGHFAHVTGTYENILISQVFTLSSDFWLLNVLLHKKKNKTSAVYAPLKYDQAVPSEVMKVTCFDVEQVFLWELHLTSLLPLLTRTKRKEYFNTSEEGKKNFAMITLNQGLQFHITTTNTSNFFLDYLHTTLNQ